MIHKTLQCGRFNLDWSSPVIMGILNLTPDSFSDGGSYTSISTALHQAERMINEGVDVIDIGAESTRPSSIFVPADEELKRLLPVVEVLMDYNIPISIDTYKPEVMQVMLDMGVDLINDVHGFMNPCSMEIVSSYNCALCVMHMKEHIGNTTHPDLIDSKSIVVDVCDFFDNQVNRLVNNNINSDRLILDPGFGFGKSVKQNYFLINKLADIRYKNLPILVGLSRKSMIGNITGNNTSNRLIGSIAAMLSAVTNGANFVRVHDVASTVEALKIWAAVNQDF
ncbi:dihydropteroate synthase [Candidatus Kinetoplastibacterium desouzaii TCC079E]|uniref:Dihydropteroate synthase n=1 Tax=Candidatus Kinetoplastidibacterium desouzai TCC079E TaxID=1208919 RepID=M1L1S3_9PROT|nr:dihydropteroate synthase [Candidatus Kinetoplastibacterium desouzaii]AGF46703.1 dihydropteroate synthase [Candidatus Kinetoplastibacterium desouzaii TCC079E]